MILNFTKHFLSYIKYCLFRSPGDLEQDIRANGFSVLNDYIDSSVTNSFISEIDKLIDGNGCEVQTDELSSDQRIFGFENVAQDFSSKVDISSILRVANNYLGSDIKYYTVMAARLKAVEGNLGSGGGWHRDSVFRHQIKCIIYLSCVNEENGPFQYVHSSHLRNLSDFDSFLNSSTRFEASAIKERFRSESIKTLVANRGTAIFADTRGIHRGKPIELGFRYAITFYMYTTKPPSHLIQLINGDISRC
jgi:hypothetical protein